MVAGGLAFTMPGLWMRDANASISITSLLIITISGALLGTLFSIVARKKYVETEQLPYPMGQAAYQTLISATQKQKGAQYLFMALGFSIIFTVLRDQFAIIPAALLVFGGSTFISPLAVWLSLDGCRYWSYDWSSSCTIFG